MNRQAPTDSAYSRSPGFASWKPWLRLLFLALWCLFALAAPTAAQQNAPGQDATQQQSEKKIDIVIVVFSSPDGDQVSVAYQGDPKPEDLKQDFATLAGELGLAKLDPKIERKPGPVPDADDITTAEAKLKGLTNWSSGTINLDPLIQTFRRYGHFRVVFGFLGNFPLQPPAPEVHNPPVRVNAKVTGAAVDYEVWIDQSKVGAGRLPSAVKNTVPGWRLWVGIAAIALVVAVGAFLIVTVVLGQRRKAQAGEGDP